VSDLALRRLQRAAAQGDAEARQRLRRRLVRAGAGEDDVGLCRACGLMVLPDSGDCPACDLGVTTWLAPVWLTTDQAAGVLGVRGTYVERLADAGHLVAIRAADLSHEAVLGVMVAAGSWYRIDWTDERQELVEVLVLRRRRAEPPTPALRRDAEQAVPGGVLFERAAVEALADTLPVPFRCPDCAGEEVGRRGWPRACSSCASRGRWTRMTELAP